MSNDLTTSLWTFFVVNNGNEKFLVWFDCQPWQKTRNGLKVTVNGLKDSQSSVCFTSERAAIDRKHSALWQRHPQSFWPTQQVTHCSVKFRTFLFSERRKKTFQHQDCNCSIVEKVTVIEWVLSYRRLWIRIATGSDGHCLWRVVVVAIGTTICHNEKFSGH